jgi:hypothetical protein
MTCLAAAPPCIANPAWLVADGMLFDLSGRRAASLPHTCIVACLWIFNPARTSIQALGEQPLCFRDREANQLQPVPTIVCSEMDNCLEHDISQSSIGLLAVIYGTNCIQRHSGPHCL